MKTNNITTITAMLFLASMTATITPISATHLPTFEPEGQREGWVYWCWVESEWIPPDYMASWYVYFYEEDENPPVPLGLQKGDLMYAEDDELDFSGFVYELRGKTMQFEHGMENPAAIGYPQIPHVVLRDGDSDGVYTGSETTLFEVPWWPDHNFFRILIFEVEIDETGAIDSFCYEFHQYYKYIQD